MSVHTPLIRVVGDSIRMFFPLKMVDCFSLDLDGANKLVVQPEDPDTETNRVTINQSVTDLDANDGEMEIFVSRNGTLILNVDAVDTGSNNDFDGDLTIANDGRMEVNIAAGWRLDGSLTLTNLGWGHPYIASGFDANESGSPWIGPQRLVYQVALDPKADYLTSVDFFPAKRLDLLVRGAAPLDLV